MKISENGLKLIKEFEGCKLKAYKDIVGILTIGFGSTENVKPGMVITAEEAEKRLIKSISDFSDQLEHAIKVPITQNQFDALCSFVYNLGIGAFRRSTLLTKLNNKDFKGAGNEFLKWSMAGGKVSSGLLRRREAEKALFLA